MATLRAAVEAMYDDALFAGDWDTALNHLETLQPIVDEPTYKFLRQRLTDRRGH